MANQLTRSQQEFVAAYVETGNATEAAKASYDVTTVGSAQAIGSRNLQKPQIQSAIVEALGKAGVTTERLAVLHNKALGWIETGDGVEKGYGMRALSLAYKVRGDIVDQGPQKTFDPAVLNVLVMAMRDLAPLIDVTPRNDGEDESK